MFGDAGDRDEAEEECLVSNPTIVRTARPPACACVPEKHGDDAGLDERVAKMMAGAAPRLRIAQRRRLAARAVGCNGTSRGSVLAKS